MKKMGLNKLLATLFLLSLLPAWAEDGVTLTPIQRLQQQQQEKNKQFDVELAQQKSKIKLERSKIQAIYVKNLENSTGSEAFIKSFREKLDVYGFSLTHDARYADAVMFVSFVSPDLERAKKSTVAQNAMSDPGNIQRDAVVGSSHVRLVLKAVQGNSVGGTLWTESSYGVLPRNIAVKMAKRFNKAFQDTQ